MDSKTAERLIDINREFYRRFADHFAETRKNPLPGFRILLDYLPPTVSNVLDIGCGEGRFGRFLQQHFRIERYTGIDFSRELTDRAALQIEGEFLFRDISSPGFLNGLGQYDLIISLATLQHIPGRRTRLEIIRELNQHLASDSRLVLSFWQFLSSDRQIKKIRPWSEVGINRDEVEDNDYLLTWKRGGIGLRYVAYIDQDEIMWLAKNAGLRIADTFYADGMEGDLNLYAVLRLIKTPFDTENSD